MVSLNALTPELLCSNLPETLAALKDDAVWKEIPLISNLPNFDQLKDMQLVRFRGLVQDMLDPEIYLETFQTKWGEMGDVKLRNGKYRDNIKLEVILFSFDFQIRNVNWCLVSGDFRKMKKSFSIQKLMCIKSGDRFSRCRFPH